MVKILNILGIVLGGVLVFVPPFALEPMSTVVGLGLITYNLYKIGLLGR